VAEITKEIQIKGNGSAYAVFSIRVSSALMAKLLLERCQAVRYKHGYPRLGAWISANDDCVVLWHDGSYNTASKEGWEYMSGYLVEHEAKITELVDGLENMFGSFARVLGDELERLAKLETQLAAIEEARLTERTQY
jgi:hypothetical protein